MEKGWKAKGLLTPLYEQVGGRARLAQLSGISVGHLSGVNGGGKDLGMAAARKLLAATTGFTLLDLGAPEAATPEEAQSIRRRLEELADLTARGFEALGVTPEQLLPPAAARSRKDS